MTLISFLIIWVGFATLKDNYSRDLSNVDKLEGIIKKTEIIEASKRVGASSSANLKLKFLNIELNNSNERLYTYDAKQEYSELNKKLKKGTKIIVYFKKLKETEIINNIFRLEIGKNIILTHKDYKEKEYFAGVVMVLFGIFMLIFGIFMLKKKGLKENWGEKI